MVLLLNRTAKRFAGEFHNMQHNSIKFAIIFIAY